MTTTDGSNWIGRALPRAEDERLLRGAGRFIADLEPVPGIRHAAIVRSPYAHARIRSIDIDRAKHIPGVVGIVTGADVERELKPFPLAVPAPVDYYPLARDKVRYVGEPVAVVVADNRYVAEDACQEVTVEYEPLPVAAGIEAALAPGAPILHERAGSNIANHRTFTYGDYERALAAASHRITAQFRYSRYTPTPIETYGVIAHFEPGTGDYTVWANFHGPFTLHPVMAQALGVPGHKLRLVVPADVGGSFGAKSAVYPYVVLMALTARLLGCPVKWIEDRAEHMQSSSSATERLTDMVGGVTDDGRIVALGMVQYDDVGAYIRPPEPATLYRVHGNLTGAYDIRALRVENVAVLTNRVPTGLVRGYGGPQLYFALERFMDVVAHKLGLDPAAVRRRNLIAADRFPYRTVSGGVYDSGNYPAVLDEALALADYEGFRQEQAAQSSGAVRLGIGMACVVEPSASNMGYLSVTYTPEERQRVLPKSGAVAAANVMMDPLGGVTVRIDTAPEGQGHETVAQQIVADVLGVEPRSVRVVGEMDTHAVPWSVASGSYSSRFAVAGASAIYQAAHKVRQKLLRIAAGILHRPVDELTLREGRVWVGGADTGVSIRRLAGMAHWHPEGLPDGLEPGVFETAYFKLPGLPPPDGEDRVNSSAVYGFLVDVVKVAVDRETGRVEVLDYVSVHDAGRLLNPSLARGQILGGLVFGLSTALHEELVYDQDGQLLTGTFLDYGVPTAAEVPPIRLGYRVTPSPLTPLGAKGLGEGNTMSAGAALANAVSDALGIEVETLPLSPARVWTLARQASGRERSPVV